MRNIVIVDAASTGQNYITDAIKRNYRPYVLETALEANADPAIFTEREQLRRRFASVAEYLNEKETYEETLEMIRVLDPILVIPGCEDGVILATKLADDLHLPGNPYANIEKYVSKRAMQEALKAYGIRYIQGQLVHSVDEAIDYYRRKKMKGCVIKPTHGAASNGVHLCNDVQEMIVAVETELNSVNLYGEKSEILMQERIFGTEYIVNTVSYAGRHRLSSVWRYKKKRVEGGGNVYEYAELITRLGAGDQRLIKYAYDVADAVDYRYGPIHGEFMVDEKGPVLIEINCRPMGGGMTDMFLDDVLGHHETDNALDTYLDPAWHEKMIEASYRPFKKAYLTFFIAPEDMKIALSPVIQLIRNMRSYHSGSIGAVASGQLKRTVDLETQGGMLYMKHENPMILEKDVEFLRKVEDRYFDMLFVKEGAERPAIPENLESVEEVLKRFGCGRSMLVLTNDEKLDVNAMIVNVEQKYDVKGKFNFGIFDLNYHENEDIESIINDFYFLVSKIHRGGQIFIPKRTYWHLPCGMESVEILCECIGLIIEAPTIKSGDVIVCTIP